MFSVWFGEKPAAGWTADQVNYVVTYYLGELFDAGPDWISWVREIIRNYPFHTVAGQERTVALVQGQSAVGGTNDEWWRQYFSLGRILLQAYDSIAGFEAAADIGEGKIVSVDMFMEQGLVKVVSGLVDGHAIDLGRVVVSILDLPPLSGRGDESHCMRVSLVSFLAWTRATHGTDLAIRNGGGEFLSPVPWGNLAMKRSELNYCGARRVYLALLETVLLLEAEGPNGPGGGLGYDRPIAFPGDRVSLGATVASFRPGLAAVAARAFRNGDESSGPMDQSS